MTTYFKEIREMIYFEWTAFKDIYTCFDYYFNRDLKPSNSNETMDKFGLSYASWDFKII